MFFLNTALWQIIIVTNILMKAEFTEGLGVGKLYLFFFSY